MSGDIVTGSNIGGSAGAKHVAKLFVTADLTSLNLHGNYLKDEGVTAICEAVTSNEASKLTSLFISDNEFGPVGAQSVAAMLAVKAELTEVR